MRNLVLLLTALFVFVVVNYGIWRREALVTGGRIVLLELAPVDPRSLMQGDYMALWFKVGTDAFPSGPHAGATDGRLVLAVDERSIGSFRRFAGATPPAANELLLRYRIRNGRLHLATDAFFFQERQGGDYRGARYGEFRVAPDGDALLVALRDANLRTLGPKAAPAR